MDTHSPVPNDRIFIRTLVFIAGLGILLPVSGLVMIALGTPITFSGVLYLTGLGMLGLGGFLFPWLPKWGWILPMLGGVVIGATMLFRIVTATGNGPIKTITLPEGGNARWINRLVDERDVVMYGLRIGPYAGLVLPDERAGAIEAFEIPFEEIRALSKTSASPFAATYLWLQRPNKFDVVVIEPETTPVGAVIYLHGFGGNFTVQCWLFARAAREAGLETLCPSTRFIGDWWQPQGQETLQATMGYVQSLGVENIYLAGLSNGGIGASRLAPQFAEALTGLIYISGVSPQAQPTGLPTLIIHSENDGRIPVSIARTYAAIDPDASLVVLPSDHFVLAKRADEVREVLLDWFADLSIDG